MRIDIQSRSFKLTRALKDHVQRRIHFALGRFSRRLEGVRVTLTDLNARKGGVDKRCKVLVSLRPSVSVVIEETDSDLIVSVDRALDRAGRTVARRIDQILDRRRSWPNRPDRPDREAPMGGLKRKS